MQLSRTSEKSDTQYSSIAVGATWFALLSFIFALATRVTIPAAVISNWRSALAIVDIHLAALITAASLLVFSGLWGLNPKTPFGQHLMVGVIALLVAINWAAWCVALWLH